MRKTTNPRVGQLKVWWIPQVPMKPFEVTVERPEDAKLLLTTLAEYDKFQLENHIKPDYCNAGGLMVWDGKEWEDWYDDDGNDIDSADLTSNRVTEKI